VLREVNLEVVYNLWLREMKRFFRAKSRLVANIAQPFFWLAILGMGFNSTVKFRDLPSEIGYLNFLVPGIMGMSLLFSSMFAGLSVLWDRQFGFLKEIMVAPVSRLSILGGMIAGSITTGLIQAHLILAIGLFFGFRINHLISLIPALAIMILIAASFTAMGISFASKMEDMHGFQLIMNFVIIPIFFLSGALFPLEGLPNWLSFMAYLNPLTYGVDGLRKLLLGLSHFPINLDFLILILFCLGMLSLGTYFFKNCEL
jgi:ABC-2 type transport system permease protein